MPRDASLSIRLIGLFFLQCGTSPVVVAQQDKNGKEAREEHIYIYIYINIDICIHRGIDIYIC